MEISDFKKIADQKTSDLELSPEAKARILAACTPNDASKGSTPLRMRRRQNRRALYAAMAACVAVICLSLGMILHGQKPIATPVPDAEDPFTQVSASPEVIKLSSPNEADLEQLKDNLAKKNVTLEGGFYDGYAPARNAQGLYGYVDAYGKWKIEPVYTSASELENGVATVIDANGKTFEITLVKMK